MGRLKNSPDSNRAKMIRFRIRKPSKEMASALACSVLLPCLCLAQENNNTQPNGANPPTTSPATSSSTVAPVQPVAITPSPSKIVLQDGTPVRMRINRTVSSADAHVGEMVDFEVLDEVKIGDLVVVPRSGLAWATVTEAQSKRRLGRGGKLNMNIDSVRLADGEKIPLRAMLSGDQHHAAEKFRRAIQLKPQLGQVFKRQAAANGWNITAGGPSDC